MASGVVGVGKASSDARVEQPVEKKDKNWGEQEEAKSNLSCFGSFCGVSD